MGAKNSQRAQGHWLLIANPLAKMEQKLPRAFYFRTNFIRKKGRRGWAYDLLPDPSALDAPLSECHNALTDRRHDCVHREKREAAERLLRVLDGAAYRPSRWHTWLLPGARMYDFTPSA